MSDMAKRLLHFLVLAGKGNSVLRQLFFHQIVVLNDHRVPLELRRQMAIAHLPDRARFFSSI